MKSTIAFLLSLFSILSLFSQDAYHNNLLNFLQNEYTLPSGEWVFSNTEDVIINTSWNYGASSTVLDVSGQDFSKKIQFVISNQGANVWDAGFGIGNSGAIQTGDVMLATFYLRAEGGDGQVSFFVENSSTFFKEIYLTFELTENWTQFFVPIESMNSYTAGSLNWGFHLANKAQTVELGGFTAINFNNAADLDDLPNEINNQFYDGYEEDAPWRSEAADRIDELRKANLVVQAMNSNGDPIDEEGVRVKMLKHEFCFGTAVTANRLAGNNAFNIVYQDKLLNLDGQGHGFNCVVFENDLKWPAWEDEWLVNKTELVNAVQWLRSNDLDIRGHTLVWPGNNNLPTDVANNINNLPYVENRINEHLEEILTYPGIAGEIEEWDVLNEIVTNTSVANAFSGSPGYPTGREIYVDIFEKARELDANTGLWLNDYVTLSINQSAGGAQYNQLKLFTQELVDSGVDIEGLGFQGHIGGAPNGIPSVLNTLDDFYNSFGLKAKITEFDLPSFVDEELAGNYLRDFLTAVYSHPSMDGFLFWSFWDGATYMNEGSNLYRQNWTETPAHDAFTNLLFNEWWTDEFFELSENGTSESRVFKGLYEISYICDGTEVHDTISITEDMEYIITCDELSTNIEEIAQSSVKVFPNPSTGLLQIQRNSNVEAQIALIDSSGKVLFQTKSSDSNIELDLSKYKGFYFLRVLSSEGMIFEKVVIN